MNPVLQSDNIAAEKVYTDPVCGMKVDPATAKDTLTHEGRTYYFCCDGCRATFLGDPARFAAIHRARGEGLPAR